VLPTSLKKHVNVRLLLAIIAVKSSRWVSHTFLQKPCSFKSFSISEENCAANIIDETFKCKTFIGKCCKKREPRSNNFILAEKSSSSVLLKFWGYLRSRGLQKGSVYVCRNLPMSHLIQFKAWKWGFGWYSNLQARKTWIFQISRLAHKVWWILGAPIWAPKSPKFYFHKL